MKQILKSKGIIFTLTCSLLLNFVHPGRTFADYTFEVKNYTNDTSLLQTNPDIFGTKMVYLEAEEGKGAPMNIELLDLTNNNKYRVNQNLDEVSSYSAKIDANNVVYTVFENGYESSQLVVADVTNPAIPVYHQITTDPNLAVLEADISGNNVVYSVINTDTYINNVFHADIANIGSPVIQQLTANESDVTYYHDLSISGATVSWTNQTGSDSNVEHANIDVPIVITSIGGETWQHGGRVDGTNLVYVDLNADETIATFKRKIVGGETNTIATKNCESSCQFSTIAVSGDNVIYTSGNSAAFLNKLTGGEEQVLVSNTDFAPFNVAIDGTVTAWEGLSAVFDREIYGTSSVVPVVDDPIYRFWSDTYKGHFYTSSEAEKNQIIANDPNWRYEADSFNGYSTPGEGRFAVYRFWSENYKHHFFTISEAEKDFVIANDPNWNFEGIAYYAYNSYLPNSSALYRFWSDNFKGHFYTTSVAEKNSIIANDPNWRFEGASYYVPN